MDYKVYVDETGDFSNKVKKNKNTDYVGGWVCHSSFPKKLIKLIKEASDPIISNTNIEFRIPDHLHFMPLHIFKLRQGKDSTITIPTSKVEPIVSNIFKLILPEVNMVFRSVGFPIYYVNEQATYIEILRSTIIQLLDEFDLTNDKVEIVIASRRISELMGGSGYANPLEYEKALSLSLSNEIQQSYEYKKQVIQKNIAISFMSSRKETGLAIADFFCGAMRYSKYNYLNNYQIDQKLKRYSIHNAYILIPNKTIPKIKNIYKNDPISATIQAFELFAKYPDDHELNNFILSKRKDFKTVNDDYIKLFAQELRSYLNEKIVNDPYRYQNLDIMNKFILLIEKEFINYNILLIIKYYKIKIQSHQGRIDLEEFYDYLKHLELNGPEVFGNMYYVAQERLEAILTIVQPAAFNIFKFELVEELLSEEFIKYNKIFPDNDDIDETRARLEGTIGQMYGFMCDYPDGDIFIKDAIHYITKDIQHCVPYSRYWEQGLGYLVSIYFRREELDNAIDAFLQETQSKEEDIEYIFDLSKLDLFKSLSGDFFLLHRLYICALGLKNGKQIDGEEKLKNILLASDKSSNYPVFLSLKWLGVIFALKEKYEDALIIFQSIDTKKTNNFTLDIIKLPIKILVHMCKKKLSKRSLFEINSEIDRFEKQVSGIKENLLRLGIHNNFDFTNKWSFYKASLIMPYYYA